MFLRKHQKQRSRTFFAAIVALLLITGVPFATSQAPAKSATATTQTATNLLDINTASAADMKALPGIGDAYSARIIAGRPYTAKNQLVQKGIIPQATYDKISSKIIAHRPK